MRIYPGQEADADAKLHNLAAMAAAVDGIVIAPGDVFSLDHAAGRPSAANGYRDAAVLRDGVLTVGEGGSTCLLSTVLYNAALLAGLEIVERHAHSVDTYGDARYFELGRDATVEYGYLDLRFRNRFDEPLLLTAAATVEGVTAAIRGLTAPPFAVEIHVSEPSITSPIERRIIDSSLAAGEQRVLHPGYARVATTTSRTIRHASGNTVVETLGESIHHAKDRVVAIGAPRARH